VGTLGLLHPIKGTDVFVAAAEQLRARGVAVDMRIAGPLEDGPFRDWGEAVVERATAAGVSYRGVVDAVAELSQWDILVQPSRGDAFPLAVLEAMEAGLAVVGADTGGITEQLEDGAGVLVPPEDPGALADAIAELARDPERIAALAAAGRRRVRTTFTLARSADALEAAWLAALRRAR
jgi:glycosyltransferase involved in cell wall biosynthesis